MECLLHTENEAIRVVFLVFKKKEEEEYLLGKVSAELKKMSGPDLWVQGWGPCVQPSSSRAPGVSRLEEALAAWSIWVPRLSCAVPSSSKP